LWFLGFLFTVGVMYGITVNIELEGVTYTKAFIALCGIFVFWPLILGYFMGRFFNLVIILGSFR